jgi:hypothetical protein
VLVGVVALTACSGGSSARSRPRTTASTASTSTTATTSTTSAPVGAARCHTAQLHVSFGAVGAGAGQRYVRLILTNSGPACQTIGYVGLQLLGSAGQALPTNVVRDTSRPVATVSLATGGQMSSVLHWGAIAAADEPQSGPCEPTPQQVEVTPPNEVQFVVAPWPGGAVCEHGRIDAGPLQTGVPPL